MAGKGDGSFASSSGLSRRDFRAMIYYDFKQGKSYQQCHQTLKHGFGDQCPSTATVFRWYRHFRSGQTSIEDSDRCGRPNTAVTPENVFRVRSMVNDDRRVTYAEIKGMLKISSGSVNTILHEHLKLRKRYARWVPHSLNLEQRQGRVDWCHSMMERFDQGRSRRVWDIVTGDETWIYQYDPETKQQSSVWVFEDEDPPVKYMRSKSAGKQMIACFFAKSGHVATVPLEDRKTVTADWYVTNCLPKVFEAWRERRPRTGTRGLLLHHDNASAHTARATTTFLEEKNVQLVAHPPYSPDLAPNDFFLFPKVKRQLKGKKFQTPEDARRFFDAIVSGLPESTWSGAFGNWFYRMDKCIESSGGHFEKLQ